MTSPVRALGVAVLKRTPWVRVQYRNARSQLRYLQFRWQGRGRRDERLAVFECFVGRSYAGSPRALYEAMLTDPRFADWQFVWSFRDPAHAREFPALADPRTTIVGYRRRGYYRAFGRARVWISNSIIAPELRPGADQIYLQTWHGTPLKRIGLDVIETTQTAMNGKGEIDDRYRVEGRKVSVFLSAAPFTTATFGSAFALPPAGGQSPFVETGNPRNDALAAATPADVAAARERLGIAAGKTVVLYAPTWRDDQHDSRSGYVHRPPLDLDALRAALGEDTVLLVRTHYLVTNVLDLAAHQGFARNVSDVDEINELCLASDILVTDYSSIYFDFALLDRPMVFYMYDLDRYANALRGFYLPITEVPGPIVKTQDELVTALRDPDLSARHAPGRRALNARMSPHDDGQSSRRVLDLLREF